VFCDDRPASILREPGLDGGALLDIGCYGVSAARLLLGEPGSVTATAVLGPSGVDERLHATLAFEGGALATVLAAIDLPERFDLEVLGSEGTIVVPSFIHGRRGELYLRRGGAEERIDVERADPYRLQLEDVCGRIRAGVPAAGGAEAVAQARVLEAIARAAATGAAVAVEPAP
jgi:predicted dehydrogenase